ncbi:MAG: glycosyltransferase family 4 protein [Gammaproteobacteria bacterium]|nr:glycosyltransferase family 4 protein [Gammaproteobacteria bacterium]
MMAELAECLAAQGKNVDIITSFPNHPGGTIHEGWRNRLLQIEHPADGIRVLRVLTLARRSGHSGNPPGRAKRIAASLVFTLAAASVALFRTRPRVIFSVLQPLTVGLPLMAVSRLKGARLAFNVQDLHPDALVALGLVRQRAVIAILRWLERTSYRRADGLAVICDRFRDHCLERGAAPDRVRVIPNWVDLDEIRPSDRVSTVRSELGLDERDFVALYAGTIGLVSGAEVVLDAAVLLQQQPIQFVFVGEGQLVGQLERIAAEKNLTNVHFLPFQPRNRVNDVLALGDVSLVTLLPGHGRTSVPSKVLAYMAAGRAVVASVEADCETARFVQAAQAGYVIPARDSQALAQMLSRLQGQRGEVVATGRNGRQFLEEHHTKRQVLSLYQKFFAELM